MLLNVPQKKNFFIIFRLVSIHQVVLKKVKKQIVIITVRVCALLFINIVVKKIKLSLTNPSVIILRVLLLGLYRIVKVFLD